MGHIYEKIEEEEILMKDVILPEHFPAIYIDENDNIYCYHSIIDTDRFLFGSHPYWTKNQKPKKIKNQIRGYFVMEQGSILKSDHFIDEETYSNDRKKCKLLPAYVSLPQPNDSSFGVSCSLKYQDLEEKLTREVFGLTYQELKELLDTYNKTFKCIPNSIYSRFPTITRSLKSDNFCDISDIWIPAKYPYIAFRESEYYYSHISIHAFYEHVKFLTMCNIDSHVAKMLIENGLKKEILENLFRISDYHFLGKRITKEMYFDLKKN